MPNSIPKASRKQKMAKSVMTDDELAEDMDDQSAANAGCPCDLVTYVKESKAGEVAKNMICEANCADCCATSVGKNGAKKLTGELRPSGWLSDTPKWPSHLCSWP